VTDFPFIHTRGTADGARPSTGGARPSAIRIDVRVTPRASKTAIDGVRDGRLVIKVTAPPVDAAANDAVVALMASTFHVPKRQVSIVLGATGRSKTVELAGASVDAVRARLSDILG
jgi:uncharacterized protein (TIGR00251 family)